MSDTLMKVLASDLFETGFNAAATIPESGYMVVHGASWVMAQEFSDEGPVADAWLTYGHSHDPKSEFYSDQTKLFGAGTWPRYYSLRMPLRMILSLARR